MSQQQRLSSILDLINDRGHVSIAEICAFTGSSTATARRDVAALTDQRLVTRTHGGVSALASGYELPLQYKIARQAQAKMAIAQAVEALISPGDTVGMNGGTTVTEVARALGKSARLRVEEPNLPGVTIVTNALNVAFEASVREHMKIVVTGGVPRRQSYELVGPLVEASLKDFYLDFAVIGVDGISARGASTVNEAEADASRHIARIARSVIVAADHTKLGHSAFAAICSLDDIDTLVTDAPPTSDFRELLDAAGVKVAVAPSPPG